MKEQAHKCLGLDPGSLSWKAAVLDDHGLIWTGKVATEDVCRDPDIMKSLVYEHRDGLQAIAAPSGFGLPLVPIDRIGKRELSLMTLKRDGPGIVGVARAIEVLKAVQRDIGAKCFVLPSVKHLTTVPVRRKINRVDLGTTDKLCAAAHALQKLVEKQSASYEDISFVLGEIGSSFVGMVCVKRGKVVDGIGGTNASFGVGASGALDAELAHIWHFPDKASLYSGGLADAAGMPLGQIEESLSGTLPPRARHAFARFVESVTCDASAMASRNGVETFVLSSVLGPKMNEAIEDSLKRVGLKVVKGINDEMSASIGAAFLVNGLIGGRYRRLSETLAIAKARGSIMDHIFYRGTPALPHVGETCALD